MRAQAGQSPGSRQRHQPSQGADSPQWLVLGDTGPRMISRASYSGGAAPAWYRLPYSSTTCVYNFGGNVSVGPLLGNEQPM